MVALKMGHKKDFWAGLIFALVGGAFAMSARAYPLESPSTVLGPGFVPFFVGVALVGVGLATIMGSLLRSAAEAEFNPEAGSLGSTIRPVASIIGACILFGALIDGVPAVGLPAMGMVVAAFAAVSIASLASPEFRLIEIPILGAALSLGCFFVFGYLLGRPLQLWPSFVTAW